MQGFPLQPHEGPAIFIQRGHSSACLVPWNLKTRLLQLGSGRSTSACYPTLAIDQECSCKLVFNFSKFSNITLFPSSLVAQIRCKPLMLAYKAKNGPAPNYLKPIGVGMNNFWLSELLSYYLTSLKTTTSPVLELTPIGEVADKLDKCWKKSKSLGSDSRLPIM